MTDIKSPTLLWIKGGLFLITGIVASTILLLPMLNTSNVALMIIAVWCFCRAYYFAFYVIEKYADPNFRYDGLISLVRYVVAHSKQKVAPESAETTESTLPDRESTNAHNAIFSCLLFWTSASLIGNIVVPVVVGQNSFLSDSDYCWTVLLGLLSVQMTWLCIFATLSRFPLKHRLTTTTIMMLVLMFGYILGVKLTGYEGVFPEGTLAFVFVSGFISFVMGISLLSIWKWMFGWRITTGSPGAESENPTVRVYQLSFRSFFIITSVMAVVFSLVRFFHIDRKIMLDQNYRELIAIGVGIVLLLTLSTLLTLRSSLRAFPKTYWGTGLLLFMVAFFPVPASFAMFHLVALFRVPLDQPKLFYGFVYFLTFAIANTVIAISLRRVGVRLEFEKARTKQVGLNESDTV